MMSSTTVTQGAPVASEERHSNFLPADKNYRLTGELPADHQVLEEEKPEIQSEKSGASAAPNSETSAASEAAPQQEPKGPAQTKTAQASENRWQKISRENKELRDRLQKLETAPRETQQVSQPATEPKPKANARPKIDDLDPKTGKAKFANWQEYEDAKDEWNRKEAIREFQETSTKSAAEQRQQQAERTLAEGMVKKFETTRGKYQDFDQVALNENLVIPRGSATDIFLLDSEHAGEVLYHLGQHPEILTGFYGDHDPKTGRWINKVNPAQQFRKLAQIEATFSGNGTTQAPPAKPVTQAPRPPNQVSGKGTVAKDAVVQAVEDNDSETYIREQNARQLAKRKGK